LSTDERGWRIALVPHDLLLGLLETLEAAGYGVLQLPPPARHARLLGAIADEVAEYAHHGYAIVAIGAAEALPGLHWRRLTTLLRSHRVAPPPRHLIRRAGDPEQERLRLTAFLKRHAPSEIQPLEQ